MQQEGKINWYDNVRVMATIGVIFIHVSSDYVPVKGTISTADFWIGNIYDSLSRLSVPLFVMLSGASLLGRNENTGSFLKKRMTRILLPFLFWSLIYIANGFYNAFDEGQHLTISEMLRSTFVQLRDGSSIHLWYVYMITGLYLFVPIIGKWIRNSSIKELEYFLMIWLITLLLDQPWLSKIRPDIDLSYFTGYLGYLIFGYYLTIKPFGNKRQTNLIALAAFFGGLLWTILGTYFTQRFTGKFVSTYYEPLSPNILLYSAGFFLFMKDKDFKNRPAIKIRTFISKYSYGIFLAHVLILFKLYDFGLGWHFTNPILAIPATVFICFTVTLPIVFIINKLPFGKYISG